MDNTSIAIELTEASWEQWIGASMRTQHAQRLLATALPRRRPVQPANGRNRTRGSLLWMLAVSAAGLWLLRL